MQDSPGACAQMMPTLIFGGKCSNGIFANQFLWSNQQRSTFNDVNRVKQVKLVMHLILFA